MTPDREGIARHACRWLDTLHQDARHALRAHARTPGLTLALILTFALGIGANVAVFSVVHGVLLRPLPYRDGDRLVLVQREQDVAGASRPLPLLFHEPDALEVWHRGMPSLESAALYAPHVAAHTTADGTALLDISIVSGTFFPTLGGPLVAGRTFTTSDELLPVAVLSESLAGRLFGSPIAALERTVTFSFRTYTVVGVAASSFRFPAPDVDAWLPAGFIRSADPRCCGFRMVGRLSAEAPVQRARAEAQALAAALVPPTGSGTARPPHVRATVTGLHDTTVAAARPALLILMAAAALMLLVACANIVNLLIARQAARSREIATRVMLGASRGRLAGQSMAETLVTAVPAAFLGVGFAAAAVGMLKRTAPVGFPRLTDIGIDLPVLAFAASVTLTAAFLTGILPALRSNRVHGGPASAGVTMAPAGRWVRRGLTIAELAVSVVLVVGAGLLGRSLVALMQTDIGVSADGVVTASMNYGFGGARRTDEEIRVRTVEILSRLEALPGVSAAGVGTSLPPNATRLQLTLRRAGESVDYQASGVAATPGYFEALGMRLARGRLFELSDDLDHPPVMIMSVDTARRFFGDGDPIGQTMTLPVLRDGVNTREEMTLVGVVANVRYSGLDAVADDAVYRPFAQQAWTSPFLVVRTTGDAGALASALPRHVAAVDPSIVLADVRPLTSILSDEAAQPRFRATVLAALAALALAIAGVGLYGVVSYSVSHRTREIGIRMALGAEPGDVVGLVLREGIGLAAAGVLVGAGLAALSAGALDALLYGVEPIDPVSFALAGAALLALALVASVLPARRAARVDPAVTLRSE